MSNICHEVGHVLNIMLSRQRDRQRLVCLEQMPQIRSVVVLACGAVASIVEFDTERLGMLPRFDLDGPLSRQN